MARRSNREAQPGRPGTLGVTSRLLAVALFPVLGLLIYVAPTVGDRVEVGERVQRMEVDVDRIIHMMALRTALQFERVPSESKVRGRGFGLDADQVSDIVGYDVVVSLRDSRIAVDRAIAGLGPDRGAIDDDNLVRVRRLTDGDAEDADAFLREHDTLLARLDAVINPALSQLKSDTLQITGGERLARSVDALWASHDVVDGTSRELTLLEKLYFLVSGDRHALEHELIKVSAAADRAVAGLDNAEVPEIKEAWNAIEAKATTQRVSQQIDNALAGNAPRVSVEGGFGQMVKDSQDWLAYQKDTLEFPTRSVDILRREAAALKTRVDDERLRSIALAFALAASAVMISLLFARSIARPLSRLASQANALNDGDLEVETRVAQGPREVVATSRAFADLVANLRLLDAKARALAEGDFEAEILKESVPGPLGDSLQASIAAMSTSRDEREALQHHVIHQATHDALTGLHNRAAATDVLDQALARASRVGDHVAVLLVDLDSFQRMNDTFGSTAGDLVLIDVAARIKGQIRAGDFVARLSSDEFLVVVEDEAGFGEITALAQKIIAAISEPIQVASATTVITACIGLAFTADGDMDADQMLSWADLAVHRAKQRSPGSVEVFDEALQRTLIERAATEEALRLALGSDELFMHYQPVVDLATGRLSGAEALIRWNRPEGGMTPPDSFIPVAESSNLIIDLDRWVLSRVARQIEAWSDQGLMTDIRVAVNISGRHLHSHDLVRNVRTVLAQTGLAPERLVIEVTETALIDDLALAASQLADLRAMGVSVALDDFGTGFTSITHLQHLPVDVIKIDRSFVDRADVERDRTLLAMIIDVAHHLGLTVTAEGIETEDQLRVLRELGCDHAQGYLLSRPLPADVFVGEWNVTGRVHGPNLVPSSPSR